MFLEQSKRSKLYYWSFIYFDILLHIICLAIGCCYKVILLQERRVSWQLCWKTAKIEKNKCGNKIVSFNIFSFTLQAVLRWFHMEGAKIRQTGNLLEYVAYSHSFLLVAEVRVTSGWMKSSNYFVIVERRFLSRQLAFP